MNIKSAHFLPGTNKRLGDKYLLLECLGDGSHGWVWRAERLADGQIVALKVPKDITKEDKQLIEGKELLDVEPHPNVIRIHNMGRIDGEWFFIEMEYFPSQTLAQKLEQRIRNFGNTFERLLKIYEQVLKAVSYLANLSPPISHGDIKPHNILVGAEDTIKLTDFGSSALPEEIYIRTRENGGTVLYAAPEYSNVDSRRGTIEELLRGDIYSLGVLLFQILTGKLPHDTPAQVQRHAPFKRPTEINSSIHPEMEKLILGCMCKKPEERFSIDDLLKAFDSARDKQLGQRSLMPENTQGGVEDWSSKVMRSLENKSYSKAAKIAGDEFARSKDWQALLYYLSALYRGNRLFHFESVFDQEKEFLMKQEGETFASIRILALKIFLALRKASEAKCVLTAIKELDGETNNIMYLEAKLKGLDADYSKARTLLERVNRSSPMRLSVLTQLVLVCEQMRDYSAASGYLKAAMRIDKNASELNRKYNLYRQIGLL